VSAGVLLVDDDDASRFTLAALLEDAGITVREAATLEEAQAAIPEEAGCLLVLADYHLDEGLGVDLIPLVREHMPGARFVIVSGDAEAGSLPGVDGVLRKGDDPRVAIARVKEWLAR
jgi:two-component system response regulator RegA